MAWTINTFDPVYTWSGYDLCIHSVVDNGMGMNEIVMLYRVSGAANPWQSMGPSDGSVWMGDMVTDVIAKGGFRNWWNSIVTAINSRIAAWVASLNPVVPTGDPKTFQELQAWLKSVNWTNSASGPVVSK